MIVVSGNPLNDLSRLRNLDMVIKSGYIVNSPRPKKNAAVESELDKYI